MAQVNTEITVIKLELSKREYFAAMALQGLLAMPNTIVVPEGYWTERAVFFADSLITALNEDFPLGNPMEGDI